MNYRILNALPALLLVAGMALPASAQNSSKRERNARMLFYQAAPEQGESGWAGVRTSLMLRVDGQDGVCQIREVDEGSQFRTGDRFRFRVQPNATGYLYLLLKGSTGEIKLLYPYEGVPKQEYRVHRFESRTVPSDEWFRFDEDYGLDRVYLFLSPKPVKELEKLASSPKRTLKDRDLDKLMDRAGDQPSMRFDEDEMDGGNTGATYYVERLKWDSDYLIRRFRLASEKR